MTTEPTPTSRRAEVEAKIDALEYHEDWQPIVESLDALARTLASEIDDLRAENERIKEGKTELNGIMDAMTKGANEAEIITKLLELLKPSGSAIRNSGPALLDRDEIYARACEIAGRKPE